MVRARWLLPVVALFWSSPTHTQTLNIPVSPRVQDALTRVIRNDGTLTAGLFMGLVGDSISLVAGGVPQMIARDQMRSLGIEAGGGGGSSNALVAMVLGVYAGNLAFFRSEQAPYAFFGDNTAFATIMADCGIAAIGGVIGYLATPSTSPEESFSFTGSEEANQREWERLRAFVSEPENERNVHISFQGAWVEKYLPGVSAYGLGPYYNASRSANLNLMRKIQMSITITRLLDAGVALLWLGQPSISWQTRYSSNGYEYGNVQMDGNGYYALGILKPYRSAGSMKFRLDIGAGLGTASIDYTSQHTSIHYPESTTSRTETMEKKAFSVMAYAEAEVFLSEYLSLGLIGDYVYIPESGPAIQETGFQSKSLSTASIGFALDFHF